MSAKGRQIVIGVALAGLLNVPALAQRSRIPPSEGTASAARPVVERATVERAAVERPAVVTPPPAPPAPAPSSSGGGRPAPTAQFASAPPRNDAESSGRRGDGGGQRGGQGGGRRDDSGGGDQGGDRHDYGGYGGGRHDGGSKDTNYSVPGAIVINPVVVYPVTVGTTQLGRTTTIGQRVVIGGPTGGQIAAPLYGPASRPYGYSGYVAYVPETIEVVNVGSAAPSAPVEERIDMPVEETREIRAASQPQAAQRSVESLASLGSQYSFTPWYAVSEFVMAGKPLRYPEAYAVAYDKATISPDAALPQAARDALDAGIPLVPYAAGTFGGITFQIEPVDAAVYVDGIFVGLLEDFTPATAPLPLPVGPHRVELRASGYRVERFEVIVTLGQVTPLSGMLARTP